MKIGKLGLLRNRKQAYQIIINDKIADICHASNTDTLENLLMDGWVSLEKWSDNQLEEYISDLVLENQSHFHSACIRRAIAEAKLTGIGRYAKRNS